jgi:hypothetical protein
VNREKILWYANRFRSMRLPEVLHRAEEAYKIRRTPPKSIAAAVLLIDHSNILSLRHDFWSDEVANYCAQKAHETLGGHTFVLGEEWSTLDRDWNTDPSSGYQWPPVPSHKVDYRHSMDADPKWSWEVNRLLYLVPVAFAVDAGLIPRAPAEEFLTSSLTHWISNCPPGRGIQWAASIEAAIRLISMTIVTQSLTDISDSYLDTVGQSVAEHAEWIKRFPSRYSSANNHRVAEICALMAAGSAWSGILTDEERAALETELIVVTQSLFSIDGIGLEQSPTYAGFTMEFIAIAIASGHWQSNHMRDELKQILVRAALALKDFRNEDGTLIRYGDDDEGKVLTVGVPESRYAAAIIQLSKQSLNSRRSGLITYAQGGVSLLRYTDAGQETTWLFDHGSLGFGQIAAHGHADVLSVSLRSGGVDWIVDPGTYKYHGDRRWRSYFRSSAAHNAPQLDGKDSSTMTGDFNWHPSKRAAGSLVYSYSDGEKAYISATHNGYEKLNKGQVARTVERLKESSYRISDEHKGTSELTTAFVLNPDCHVTPREEGWTIQYPGQRYRLEIDVAGSDRNWLVPPDQEAAWYSARFGHKVPTWRVGATAGESEPSHRKLVFNIALVAQ